MNVKSRIAALLIAFSAALTTSVLAQVQTGSILVRANDAQGAVVPGVAVSISSPVLVAGQMTSTTDASGACRFPSLPPGTYTVKLELQGFQSVIRENIVVAVGQTTPVDLAMNVATLQESVTVTGASPVIDTTNANVNVTLSQDLLQKTPNGRDIWSLMEYKVPGLVSSRPDVGGTAGGLQGAMVARGTTNGQNSQYLNGINVGDPSAIGFAGYYYDYDAFEELQISTGAHDLSVPTSGLFLNMTTKTGGDRWQGKGAFYWEGDSTQSRNIDNELAGFGFKPDTNKVDFVSDVTFNAGGPILKDKVRFFGAFRDWRVHINVPAAFSESVLDETNITSGLGNVTWQINNDNRFSGFYSRQYYKKPNRFLAGGSGVYTSESNSNEDDVFNVYQALWNSVITSKLYMDARLSVNTIFFPLYFNGTNQTLLDNTTGIRTGNALNQVEQWRNRYQGSATFQYYLDEALGGRHEFRFGFDQSHVSQRVITTRWDDVSLVWLSGTNSASTVTLFNTPVETKAAVDVTSLFVQDSYSIKRLTVSGGIRYERVEAYLPEQSSPPSPLFPDLPRSFDKVDEVVLWHTWGPRMNVAYDLMGDGRTALKFSAGRYYYQIAAGTANAINLNANYQELYTWNDANRNLRWEPGEQTGAPVITSGVTTSFDPEIKRPYTNEFTAGVDRELIPGVKLATVYTYRVERNPQATLNPDFPFASTTTSRTDVGRDGLANTADDGTFVFFNRSSTANRTVITHDPNSRQTYNGIEITATKRFANRWQLLGGYTYSRAKIKDLSVPLAGTAINGNPNTLILTDGPIELNDRPHQFKLTGTYVLPWYDIYVSGNYRAQSGPPIRRQVTTALQVGGTTAVNAEPFGTDRLDTLRTLDFRVSKAIALRGDDQIELDLDIFNLTNANTIWDVNQNTGRTNVRPSGDPAATPVNVPLWGLPTQVLAPRIIRFGVSYRF
jgi:Carboxypeptidase regulatory-like domain/TonB-dependent Receptor Plug Domain